MARSAKKSTAGKSNRTSSGKIGKKTDKKAAKKTVKKAAAKKAVKKTAAKKTAAKKSTPGKKAAPRKTVTNRTSSSSTIQAGAPDFKIDENQGGDRRTLIAGFVLVGIIVVFLFAHFLRDSTSGSLSPTSGEVRLPGLSQPASIRRDSLGVPVIQAKSKQDLFYAIGYAMAQDRLWQMHSMRMTARGRLAEIIGPKMLDTDIFMRSFGLERGGRKAYASMNIEMKQLLERFAAGVNDYIRLNPRLPVEFRLSRTRPDPWLPEDCLMVGALMQMSLSYNRKEEFAYLKLAGKLGARRAAWLFPSYPDEPLPFREADKLRGVDLAELRAPVNRALAFRDDVLLSGGIAASNNWALAPSRTRGRRTIVANDTHLKISMPSAWMLMHVKAPGYEVAGVSIAGAPFVILGFNGRIAWGATMTVADNQDLFVERIRPARSSAGSTGDGSDKKDALEYLYKGRWLPVRKEMETFRVKGGDVHHRPVYFTRHGPLVHHLMNKPRRLGFQPVPFKPKYGLAVSWTISGGDRTANGLYAMAQARNMAKARRALSLLDGIALNIVYGDRRNIGWQVTGRLPRRGAGRGHLPSPGWTGQYDWKGYLPFATQPHRMNPPEGFIGTANQRIAKRPPPLHISSAWAGPARADRLRELLKKTRNATADSMHKMHMDTISPMSRATRKMLLRGPESGAVRRAIARLKPDDRRLAEHALAVLKNFNDDMRADSAPAALMGAFYHVFTRNVFMDELGPEDGEYWKTFLSGRMGYGAGEDHLHGRKNSPYWDNVNTKDRKETRADILALSLAHAVGYCEDKMGAEKNWRWGRLHTYTWRHSLSRAVPFSGWYLNRGPFPANGSRHTLNVSGFPWGKHFHVGGIPAMRLVVDFSLKDPAYLVTHSGQSGNPASSDYDTMIEYFRTGRNNPLPFLEKNIEKQYTRVLRLTPAER